MHSSTHGNCFYNCLADLAYVEQSTLNDEGEITHKGYTAAVESRELAKLMGVVTDGVLGHLQKDVEFVCRFLGISFMMDEQFVRTLSDHQEKHLSKKALVRGG